MFLGFKSQISRFPSQNRYSAGSVLVKVLVHDSTNSKINKSTVNASSHAFPRRVYPYIRPASCVGPTWNQSNGQPVCHNIHYRIQFACLSVCLSVSDNAHDADVNICN